MYLLLQLRRGSLSVRRRRRRRRAARIIFRRPLLTRIEEVICCALLDGADPGWHRRMFGGPGSCPARTRFLHAVDEFMWRLRYGGPHYPKDQGDDE